MTDIRFINPATLAKPPSYTHVVEVVGPAGVVHIAGQLGTDREGNVVGEPHEFRPQAIQVFENLKAALAAVGGSFANVVKLNSYLADIAHLPILRDVRAGYLNADALPASTTLGGLQFARPGALLEIEAVAVLPLQAASAKRARARTSTARSAPRGKKVSVRRKRK